MTSPKPRAHLDGAYALRAAKETCNKFLAFTANMYHFSNMYHFRSFNQNMYYGIFLPHYMAHIFTYLPSSLAMLDISDHNLNRLLHFSTNISAFPFLRYLTIHFDNSRYTIDSELVLTFLLYRKAHGLSVPDLKLVGQIWAGDWDLLDCMVGLKVRWIENEKSNVESEYICGTGQPGLLAFSWRSEPRPSHTVPDLHVSQWRWYDEL